MYNALENILKSHHNVKDDKSYQSNSSNFVAISQSWPLFILFLSNNKKNNHSIFDFVSRLNEFNFTYAYCIFYNDEIKFENYHTPCVHFYNNGKFVNLIIYHEVTDESMRVHFENKFFKKMKKSIFKNEIIEGKKKNLPLGGLNIEGGCVYVLESASAPNLLKIGCTKQNLKYRIQQVKSGTGVLPDLNCVAVYETKNPNFLEKDIHHQFSNNRICSSREFFKIDLEKVSEYAARRNVENIYIYDSKSNKFELNFTKISQIKSKFRRNTLHCENNSEITAVEVKKEKLEDSKNINILLKIFNKIKRSW